MVPSDIISVPSFPVTNNGKIDRVALTKLALKSAETYRHTHYHPGELSLEFTSSEALVATAWATVLHIPQSTVPLERTFVELGGDSVSAIRVISLCRGSSGVSISFNDFNDASTVRAQAALIDSRLKSGSSGIPKDRPYVPFELLSPEKNRLEVLDAARSYGIAIDNIEDAYPCTAYISGLISLSASSPQVINGSLFP